MNLDIRPRVFSGIQPTGLLHVGNYLGALKQWVQFQHRYEAIYGIMDWHALTMPQNPRQLGENTLKTAAALLALGLDPRKCLLLVQSHVPQHAELMWLLSTVTPLSRLKEMHQFKEKAKKQGRDVNAGLFMYPVLMAADILLYDTQVVPVGEDQVQHVELARLIARKFNNRFGQVFIEPKAQLVKDAARIMALTDPKKKMSKSDAPKSYLGLFEDEAVIRNKIKAAVTDSGTQVTYEPNKKPALANLVAIGAGLTGTPPADYARRFTGQSYAEFKAALARDVLTTLAPARQRYEQLLVNPENIRLTLEQGADAAKERAEIKMAQARQAIDLLN